jgi:hypothetical protein
MDSRNADQTKTPRGGRWKAFCFVLLAIVAAFTAFAYLDGGLGWRVALAAAEEFPGEFPKNRRSLLSGNALMFRSYSPDQLVRYAKSPVSSWRGVSLIALKDSIDRTKAEDWKGVLPRTLSAARSDSDEALRDLAVRVAVAAPLPQEDVGAIAALVVQEVDAGKADKDQWRGLLVRVLREAQTKPREPVDRLKSLLAEEGSWTFAAQVLAENYPEADAEVGAAVKRRAKEISPPGPPAPRIGATLARRPELTADLAGMSPVGKRWAFEAAPKNADTEKLARADVQDAIKAGEPGLLLAIIPKLAPDKEILRPFLDLSSRNDARLRRVIADYFTRTAAASVGAAESLPKDAVAAHFNLYVSANPREKAALASALAIAFGTPAAKNPFPSNSGPRDPARATYFRELLRSRSPAEFGPAMGFLCSVVEPSGNEIAEFKKRLEADLQNADRSAFGSIVADYLERKFSGDAEIARLVKQYRLPAPEKARAAAAGS